MSTEHEATLEQRRQECERQIQALHDGKVVDDDPEEMEGALLEEQDAIEYELGMEETCRPVFSRLPFSSSTGVAPSHF